MKKISLSVATNFDDRLLDAISGYPVEEVFEKLPAIFWEAAVAARSRICS